MTNGTRRGWGVSVTPRPLFTPLKYPVPIVQEAGWAPEPIWRSAKNLAPTGIRSPDRPARSQSLYRLRYPAHDFRRVFTNTTISMCNVKTNMHLKKYGVKVWTVSIRFRVEAKDKFLWISNKYCIKVERIFSNGWTTFSFSVIILLHRITWYVFVYTHPSLRS
jgi:hypothetical protein